MKLGIQFPAVANAGVSAEVAKELSEGLTVLFSGTPTSSALGILLTGTLNMAAKMLPRDVLDGIYEYETAQVYGPRPRERSSLPRVSHRRRRG